ncbi:DUF2813 domain-containing protein [Dongshaea marina]|uniref:DUF2813 domain-containing protein n=1 Tax=Dongshaea marina TaxID=2047966 RepID=UPI000D3EB947|nr:DUF2813 domain-containing protein [Dongshaea marina]
MFLEQVDVVGFRGISRLSLKMSSTTVLIGENAWGKSSFLDLLCRILGQDSGLYQFSESDFHQPWEDELESASHLHVVLTFRERRSGSSQSKRLEHFKPVWCESRRRDKYQRIYYRLSAEHSGRGVSTEHSFLDRHGHSIELENSQQLLLDLVAMNPVIRIRDARANRELGETELECSPESQEDGSTHSLELRLEQLTHKLSEMPQQLSESEVRDGMHAIRCLLEHYFLSFGQRHQPQRRARDIAIKPVSMQGLSNLTDLVRGTDNRHARLALMGVVGTLLTEGRTRMLRPDVRPILIVEDPESRLHPTLLALAWGLVEQLPAQKLVTTNSLDLLASIPLNQIRRLVRHQHKIEVYRLGNEFYSAEDLRKIAFHLRLNRPGSLFARCWLLVEGETELWLLSELARVCGYSLRAEGVRIIEFAQCGIKPLIKLARDFGVEWHLLTDGDEAGLKYANTVQIRLEGEREKDRLTVLPARDIEHFLYKNGFEEVYRKAAGSAGKRNMPQRRIIEKAISRYSKPGMALSILEAIEAQPESSIEKIPLLFRQLFARVISLARRQAG